MIQLTYHCDEYDYAILETNFFDFDDMVMNLHQDCRSGEYYAEEFKSKSTVIRSFEVYVGTRFDRIADKDIVNHYVQVIPLKI